MVKRLHLEPCSHRFEPCSVGGGPMLIHLSGRLLSQWCELAVCHIGVDEIIVKYVVSSDLLTCTVFLCIPVSLRY